MKTFLFPFTLKTINLIAFAAAFLGATCVWPLVGSVRATSIVNEERASTTNSEIVDEGDDTLDGGSVNASDASDAVDAPNPAASPPLLIVAVNPGYKVDGLADTGEFIELVNQTTSSLDLSGYALRYTNGSGNMVTLLEFPDGSSLDGDSLILRYVKSPNAASAHQTYTPSLALSAGPLELVYRDTIIDSLCWTGKNDCARAFKSASPTTLVRNFDTGSFEHLADYAPPDPLDSTLYWPTAAVDPDLDSDPDADAASSVDPETELGAPKCRALVLTEIYAYYTADQSEQFIELYNPADAPLDLAGCAVRYKKKTYPLSGTIAADGYLAYRPTEFSLTKNPTTSNLVELIDADGEVVDDVAYPHGQKKSTAYALFYDSSGQPVWRLTYAPTPDAANVYQEFRTCPTGKVINPETGNCVNATSFDTTLAACPAGKYRNPLTGRCKTIETETALAPCAEGYERNPATNRCRKITSENTGADFALVPTTRSDSKTFIAFGIVALVVALGLGYIVLQFRHEIARAGRKLRERLNRVREHYLAWRDRRHRHQDS